MFATGVTMCLAEWIIGDTCLVLFMFTSNEFPVPKYMGMNASQIMQVVYMVNPMNLASLKFSGTFLVLMA